MSVRSVREQSYALYLSWQLVKAASTALGGAEKGRTGCVVTSMVHDVHEIHVALAFELQYLCLASVICRVMIVESNVIFK